MPGPSLPSDAFQLGDLIVVPTLNRLVRGDQSIDLEPRVMGVLEVLARTPGEVVARATLFDVVWSDTVVNDEALTRAVSELRKALNDGAPDAIETIRGTGYRLVLPVLTPATDDAPADLEDEETNVAIAADRSTPMVMVAVGLATVALAVAVWAAWPRVVPQANDDVAPRDSIQTGSSPAPPLDSTSRYYQPGLSEMGVYFDSTEGRYFRFEDDISD